MNETPRRESEGERAVVLAEVRRREQRLIEIDQRLEVLAVASGRSSILASGRGAELIAILDHREGSRRRREALRKERLEALDELERARERLIEIDNENG